MKPAGEKCSGRASLRSFEPAQQSSATRGWCDLFCRRRRHHRGWFHHREIRPPAGRNAAPLNPLAKGMFFGRLDRCAFSPMNRARTNTDRICFFNVPPPVRRDYLVSPAYFSYSPRKVLPPALPLTRQRLGSQCGRAIAGPDIFSREPGPARNGAAKHGCGGSGMKKNIMAKIFWPKERS